MTSRDGLEVLEQLRERVAVGPAPITRIIAGARARRRRRRTSLVAVAAGVAAVVIAISQFPGPDRGAEIVDIPHPGLPWWSEGVLHLGDHTVEIEDVTHLAPTSTGAVVQTSDGVVSSVVDGQVTAIGTTQTLPSFVVDPVRGWVAWTEPDHEMVVLDPATGTEVARRTAKQNGLETTELLIVLEDGVLTYDNRYGNRIWDIDAGTQTRLGNGASYLFAQRGDVQLVQPDVEDSVMAVLRSGEEAWRMAVTDPNSSWALSPDAHHLLGVTGTGDAFAWDADTGREQATGLAAGTSIISAAFVGTEGVAYTLPDGDGVDLVVCDLPGPGATCHPEIEDRPSLVLPDTFWMNPPFVG
jgi:hypothetical protein